MLDNKCQNKMVVQEIDEEPFNTMGRDLRASKRDWQRDRKQKEKYSKHRATNPGMIGKLYFELTMTTPEREEEALRPRKRQRRTRRHGEYPANQEEKEDKTALAHLRKNFWGSFPLETSGLIASAASSANRNRRISGRSLPEDGMILPSQMLDCTLELYRQYANSYKEWSPDY